jgi:ABC-type thiamin/hydroxymethylpyrimidine transport system permease subunit
MLAKGKTASLHFTLQAWRATVLPSASVASLGWTVAGYFFRGRRKDDPYKFSKPYPYY